MVNATKKKTEKEEILLQYSFYPASVSIYSSPIDFVFYGHLNLESGTRTEDILCKKERENKNKIK